MVEYIYECNLNPRDFQSDITDFETNYKASAIEIDDLLVNQTSYVIIKNYSDFKDLVIGDIEWADVKFTIKRGVYNLYLISGSAL